MLVQCVRRENATVAELVEIAATNGHDNHRSHVIHDHIAPIQYHIKKEEKWQENSYRSPVRHAGCDRLASLHPQKRANFQTEEHSREGFVEKLTHPKTKDIAETSPKRGEDTTRDRFRVICEAIVPVEPGVRFEEQATCHVSEKLPGLDATVGKGEIYAATDNTIECCNSGPVSFFSRLGNGGRRTCNPSNF